MNCNNNFNLGLNSNSCNDGLRHIEQIALNKAGIDCLNGRMSRTESDIKERYTKAELDQILACKMDKCGYGRPHHHGNGKPSICDYYTKEELDQLLAEIACKCDTYSKEELDDLLDKIACACDYYSKAEVDELLENKVNIPPIGLPEIYVEKTGSDEDGDGTQAHPFATINRAFEYYQSMHPKSGKSGDTIIIGTGEWDEAIDWSCDGYLSLRGAGMDETKIITPNGMRIRATSISTHDLTVHSEQRPPDRTGIITLVGDNTGIGRCKATCDERVWSAFVGYGIGSYSQNYASNCERYLSCWWGLHTVYNNYGTNVGIYVWATSSIVLHQGATPTYTTLQTVES